MLNGGGEGGRSREDPVYFRFLPNFCPRIIYIHESKLFSIRNDTSNSIHVNLHTSWVEDWRIALNQNLIADWNVSGSCTDYLFLVKFSTQYTFSTRMGEWNFQIFISAIINVDFITSFSSEWNLDPSLHDYESTFHSGSEWKNGMNSIQNELLLNRIHVNKYNSIPYGRSGL